MRQSNNTQNDFPCFNIEWFGDGRALSQSDCPLFWFPGLECATFLWNLIRPMTDRDMTVPSLQCTSCWVLLGPAACSPVRCSPHLSGQSVSCACPPALSAQSSSSPTDSVPRPCASPATVSPPARRASVRACWTLCSSWTIVWRWPPSRRWGWRTGGGLPVGLRQTQSCQKQIESLLQVTIETSTDQCSPVVKRIRLRDMPRNWGNRTETQTQSVMNIHDYLHLQWSPSSFRTQGIFSAPRTVSVGLMKYTRRDVA